MPQDSVPFNPARQPIVEVPAEEAQYESVESLPAIPAGSAGISPIYRNALDIILGVDQAAEAQQPVEEPGTPEREAPAIEVLIDEPAIQGATLRSEAVEGEEATLPGDETGPPEPEQPANRELLAEIAARRELLRQQLEQTETPLPVPAPEEPKTDEVEPEDGDWSADGDLSLENAEPAVFDPDWDDEDEGPAVIDDGPVPVVCNRRSFAEGEPYLPICDPSGQEMETFIAHMLGGLGELGGRAGRKAMITFHCRPIETKAFRAEAKSWLTAHKLGATTPSKSRRKYVGWKGKMLIASLLCFGVAYLTKVSNPVGLWSLLLGWIFAVPMVLSAFYTLRTGQRLGGGAKEEAAEDDGPDEAHKELHKEVRSLVNAKLTGGKFFEVTIDVTAYSLVDAEEAEEEFEDLEHVVESISSGIESSLEDNEHNYIGWYSTDKIEGGIDVLQNSLPKPERDKAPLILSNTELAAMIKVPDETLRSVAGVTTQFSTLRPLHPQHAPHVAPDPLRPPKGLVSVGMFPNSSDGSAIAIENRSLDKHMLIVGRAGSGKSVTGTHIANGIIQDDYPIITIDPHGELVDDILASALWLCPERIDDLVLVNIGDLAHPVAINPLDARSYEEVEWCVDNTLKMMENNLGFGTASHPQARQLARLALKGMATMNVRMRDLITDEEERRFSLLTPLHVNDFFLDPEFRQPIVDIMADDSDLAGYFDHDRGSFTNSSQQKQIEITMPIQRVFSALKNNDAFARTLCLDNRLDFTQLIRGNKIVLFRLGGFEGAGDLGLVLAQMMFPAILNSMGQWGRTKDPATGERIGRGVRLLGDELPELARGNELLLGKVLAQARKYDFGLIGFAQFLRQISPELQEEFKANTSNKISFKLDPGNAKVMSENISGEVKITERDIVALPRFAYYGTLVADEDSGSDTGVFAAQSLKPIPVTQRPQLDPQLHRKRQQVVEASRQLISNDAKLADERLADLKGSALRGMVKVLKAHNAEEARKAEEAIIDISGNLEKVDPSSGNVWDNTYSSRADQN